MVAALRAATASKKDFHRKLVDKGWLGFFQSFHLAWLLHQPGVTAPIIGASKIEHLKDAVEAVDLVLSDDERKLLEEPYKPHPILGHS